MEPADYFKKVLAASLPLVPNGEEAQAVTVEEKILAMDAPPTVFDRTIQEENASIERDSGLVARVKVITVW